MTLDELLRQLMEQERLERSARGMIYRALKKGEARAVGEIADRLVARKSGLARDDAVRLVTRVADEYCRRTRWKGGK